MNVSMFCSDGNKIMHRWAATSILSGFFMDVFLNFSFKLHSAYTYKKTTFFFSFNIIHNKEQKNGSKWRLIWLTLLFFLFKIYKSCTYLLQTQTYTRKKSLTRWVFFFFWFLVRPTLYYLPLVLWSRGGLVWYEGGRGRGNIIEHRRIWEEI